MKYLLLAYSASHGMDTSTEVELEAPVDTSAGTLELSKDDWRRVLSQHNHLSEDIDAVFDHETDWSVFYLFENGEESPNLIGILHAA
jgi:hypothetical protein